MRRKCNVSSDLTRNPHGDEPRARARSCILYRSEIIFIFGKTPTMRLSLTTRARDKDQRACDYFHLCDSFRSWFLYSKENKDEQHFLVCVCECVNRFVKQRDVFH